MKKSLLSTITALLILVLISPLAQATTITTDQGILSLYGITLQNGDAIEDLIPSAIARTLPEGILDNRGFGEEWNTGFMFAANYKAEINITFGFDYFGTTFVPHNNVPSSTSTHENWEIWWILQPFGGTQEELSALTRMFAEIEYGGISIYEEITRDSSSAPVPEPATMMLFGLGLLGLAGVSRKKH